MGFNTILLIIFIGVSILHLFSTLKTTEKNEQIRKITKTLLMPLLICFYFLSYNKEFDIKYGLIIGLFFGWLGDIFLLMPKSNKKYFMAGLGSFLIGHVFYIFQFSSATDYYSNLKASFWLILLLYFVLLMISLKILSKDLGKLFIPVIIYMCVIMWMSISAFSLVYSTEQIPYNNSMLVAIGSLFFILSDFLLAYDTFKRKLSFGRLWVMSTYILAQSLLVLGCL